MLIWDGKHAEARFIAQSRRPPSAQKRWFNNPSGKPDESGFVSKQKTSARPDA
jgi:hypothetical protein